MLRSIKTRLDSIVTALGPGGDLPRQNVVDARDMLDTTWTDLKRMRDQLQSAIEES